MRKRRSFTLIELIVSILIIAIIAAVPSSMIISLIELLVYLPHETVMITDMQELLDKMIEGEPEKPGMRFGTKIIDASPTQFTYMVGYPVDAYRRIIRLRYDSTTGRIYRSCTNRGDITGQPGQEEDITSSTKSDVFITGKASSPATIFTYYKDFEVDKNREVGILMTSTDPLSDMKVIDITIAGRTGSGSTEAMSGIAVRRYHAFERY
ncbi:MAG: prepilin-type N-terminal cleavage/methylation domain-containing protein [Candidatus Omnitrophica bacterium]|nr:prepilin-type N-terminal cleavage/methylation domain-containing protein [Candidatus Omnitrophota bacterium]